MYQPGYSLMGIAYGAKSLFESYNKTRNVSFVGWSDDGKFGFIAKGKNRGKGGRKAQAVKAPALNVGDVVYAAPSREEGQQHRPGRRSVCAAGPPEEGAAAWTRSARGSSLIASRV